MTLLVPAFAAAVVLLPYGCYLDRQSKEEEYRRLILELRDGDPAPFLARLRVRRSRALVQDHLEQFLVCAGAESRPEIVDALAALDPHGKEGFALCAVSRYGQPATVSRLLGEGYPPTRAHHLSGQSCEPLLELSEASTATPPCSLSMLGDFDEFEATPTVEGCRHRAEVAELLIEAGASSASFRVAGCNDGGGREPAQSDGSRNESGAE